MFSPRHSRPSALSQGGIRPPVPAQGGIRIPINGEAPASAYVAIQKLNCAADGLPLWGPGNAGVTVIRRVKHEQETGFYASFWLSPSRGNVLDTQFDNAHYWGMHPFPTTSPGANGTSHYWEIATQGFDYTANRNGASVLVTKGQWYTQAIRVIHNGGGSPTKTLIYYFNLPSVANADVIEVTTAPNYGDSAIPGGYPYGDLAVTLGDSPWFGSNQHERHGGILAEHKIFAAVLSEADMLLEAGDLSRLVTSAGQSSIWWGKNNFDSVDDLTCDFGTGRTLAWADSANKGTLVAI